MAIDRTGISSLQSGAPEIKYTGAEGPKSPDQQLMAQADPQIVEMYQQYVFEMEEQGMQPMSFREFMQQALSGMADGGRAGFQYGGGADFMNTHKPRPRGNPAVMEEVEDMREWRIANPNVEDVADYKGYYERLKKLEQLRRLMQGVKSESMAYGGSANPTYTQKRKQNLAYGGIAGIDGRKRYGIGSWFQEAKDKIVDDIIPNEIKENPLLSSVVTGALLNQFGLPDIVTRNIGLGEDVGQNWLGGLLSKIPGVPEGINTVLGDDVPFLPGINQDGGGGYPNPDLDPTTLPKSGGLTEVLKKVGQTIIPGGETGYMDLYGPSTMNIGGKQTQFNWKAPLAAGLSIGAMDALTRKDESLPAQPGIDIADIRSRALTGSDSDLRFLPPASATTAYANGGRTGYYAGERVEQNVLQAFSAYKNQGGPKDFDQWHSDIYLPEMAEKFVSMKPDTDTLFKDPLADWPYGFAEPGTLGSPDAISIGKMAQGGRIGAQEGGLMDLGGMEKDYRNEGGFVPIGGQERADDVPARLSKNEFVFTADAVRAAGGGDIDKGAEVMENMMENLEKGGKVSEESQGLKGARDMFATAQRLEGVL